jgi:DNA polymerase
VNPDHLRDHLAFAAELGVAGVSRDPAWRRRESAAAPPTVVDSGATASEASQHDLGGSETAATSVAQPLALITRSTLEAIRADIGDCTRCKLHTLGRQQIVFGVGSPQADLMFVGEAPGADEDVQGVPFVGKAGQLLTRIIEAIALRREDVYIANVIKCRPPQNRNPEPDEVATCELFLFRQIDAVQPKVIVSLGKFATHALLRTEEPISRLRGRVFDYRGSKLIPTFHPAYLLRNPSSKREVWEDMKLVKRLLTD